MVDGQIPHFLLAFRQALHIIDLACLHSLTTGRQAIQQSLTVLHYHILGALEVARCSVRAMMAQVLPVDPEKAMTQQSLLTGRLTSIWKMRGSGGSKSTTTLGAPMPTHLAQQPDRRGVPHLLQWKMGHHYIPWAVQAISFGGASQHLEHRQSHDITPPLDRCPQLRLVLGVIHTPLPACPLLPVA